jgi:hypothetical protein
MSPDRSEEAWVVEPVDPFEGGELHGFCTAPWPASVDRLRFEQAVDRLGKGIVVGIAPGACGSSMHAANGAVIPAVSRTRAMPETRRLMTASRRLSGTALVCRRQGTDLGGMG